MPTTPNQLKRLWLFRDPRGCWTCSHVLVIPGRYGYLADAVRSMERCD